MRLTLIIGLILCSIQMNNAQSTDLNQVLNLPTSGVDWNVLNTADGYIKFGPAHSSYAHIYTDAPYFIFNKPVSTTANAFTSYNGSLQLQVAKNTKMTLTSTGNVGIGVSDPDAKLEIKDGTIKIGGQYNRFAMTVNYWDQNIDQFSIAPENNGAFDWNKSFVLDGNGTMYKKVDGNYSAFTVVNTTSSNDVFRIMGNGKVYATEIEVMLAPFPDYVFKPTYTLMPLKELDNCTSSDECGILSFNFKIEFLTNLS